MSGGVWAGLLVGRVFAAVDSLIDTGAEADGILAALSGPRLDLSEALSASAAVYGIQLPRSDDRAAYALRRYGRPAAVLEFGVVGILPDGRLALGAGSGRAIESLGEVLGIVATPGAGRYTELWEIPGAVYMRGAQ